MLDSYFIYIRSLFHSSEFCLICLAHLIGSDMVCPEEGAIFDCAKDDGTLIEWIVSSTCGSFYHTSFSSSSYVGRTKDVTLCSTNLMFTVTSLTRFSISVTLTIHTPVMLNGTRIIWEGQTLTLHVLSCKLI